MKYMGSKKRIAKHILPIMLANRKEGQYWVEPFVGGANMIDKVTGNRIGADLNRHCIDALILIRDSPELIPRNNTEYTEEMYNRAKKSDFKTSIDCFALFNYSFGAKFKGGWARNNRGTDYVKECVRNVLIQSKKLKGIKLQESTYQGLVIPPNSIIYCDPPYEGTTKYKDGFEHDKFWQWCRDKECEGHKVFISEYKAPDDFKCVWEKEIRNNVGNNTEIGIERLYEYCG